MAEAEQITVGGWKATGRWFAKCKRCKSVFREDREPSHGQMRVDGCPVCTKDGTPAGARQKVQYKQVFGSPSPTPCDARCQNATGPDCECSCSGDNHGANR
jgi:hypothetical protein